MTTTTLTLTEKDLRVNVENNIIPSIRDIGILKRHIELSTNKDYIRQLMSMIKALELKDSIVSRTRSLIEIIRQKKGEVEIALEETEKEISIRKEIIEHFGNKQGCEIIIRSENSKEMLYIEGKYYVNESPWEDEEELDYWYKKLGIA